jgi:D-alanyl-D-alanine carboxypeptidase
MGQEVSARIVTPLHLAQTSYPYVVALPEPRVTPYDANVDTGATEALPYISPTGLAGAGARVSTLDDMQTWGAALGDGRLVGAELQCERINRSRAVTNGPEYDAYGLGIGILDGWWGHTGSGFGFQAATFYDPHTHATIAALVNSTPSGGRRDLNVAEQIFVALAGVVESR